MTTARKLEIDGKSVSFEHDRAEDGSFTLEIGAKKYKVTAVSVNGDSVGLKVDGFSYDMTVAPGGKTGEWNVEMESGSRTVRGSSAPRAALQSAAQPQKRPSAPAAAKGAVVAPMPGKVLAVLVEKGRKVSVGDVLLTLEAMKMENRIESPAAGEVAEIMVGAGQAVGKGDTLLVIR